MKASLLLVSALLLGTLAEAYDDDYHRNTMNPTTSDQYRTPEQREFSSRAAENTYESTGRSMRDKYIRASNTSHDTYQDQYKANQYDRTRE
ncbi:hypothetical protein [Bdellovibrio sp. NC01]|uniref:hypothetical protein n=1 Tax=Bdellovibrio sp. NC01 TaxID=2220073 RepID=UPI001159DC63|nr:hypothetical protein [Bdellovibrio sp. NC01]QDK38165.1 hypothetical protein DOE51_11515 [Bdellovibrio sp. NC01]